MDAAVQSASTMVRGARKELETLRPTIEARSIRVFNTREAEVAGIASRTHGRVDPENPGVIGLLAAGFLLRVDGGAPTTGDASVDVEMLAKELAARDATIEGQKRTVEELRAQLSSGPHEELRLARKRIEELVDLQANTKRK